MVKNFLNRFFDKIFVISLADNEKRWEQVEKQFKRRQIKIERFIAVDGRCKNLGKSSCLDKLKTFEMIYNVKIPHSKKDDLRVIVPAASLTIGTILLLRAMVKNKWDHMLICEDDIYLLSSFIKKFKEGIKEIGDKKWDVLYLGCGGVCGMNGVSFNKSKRNKHLSPWVEDIGEDIYNFHYNDLRVPCEEDDECKKISKHITQISSEKGPGGTWCYAYSLRGAKRVLKYLDNNAGNHIDQLLIKLIYENKIKALSFDPPIVMHEDIRGGRQTDIPWK